MIKVGLDVHAAKIAICVQVDGATPQPAQLVLRESLLIWLTKLRAKHPGATVISCYEAGPLGYALHRELTAAKITNYVVAPQRLAVMLRDVVEEHQPPKAIVRGEPVALPWVARSCRRRTR